MHKQTFSLGFACAVGAFVGAVSALEIATHFPYGWAFGALMGGVVAYLVVDFRQLLVGLIQAYRHTVVWKPDHLYWKSFCISFGGTMAFGSTISIAFGALMFSRDVTATFNAFILFEKLMISCLAVLGVGIAYFQCHADSWRSNHGKRRVLLRVQKQGYWEMVHLNPLSFLLFVARFLLSFARGVPAALAWCSAKLPAAYRQVCALVVRVFIYVHSARRTICFVDATIGAAAGYYFGSAAIGAVVGAVLGVVNYELVSIRWLKLMPMEK